VTWLMGATAVLSMLLAFGIWWIYFGLVSGHKPQPTMSKVGQWFYLHLPLTAGIAAAGAAVFNIIEHSGEPLDTAVSWLLAGSVALVLLCVPLLMRVLRLPGKLHPYYQRGCLLLLLVALLSLLLGLPGLPLLPLLAGLVILLLVPVGYAVGVWVQEFGGREVPIK
jgi:low temperature requirement protein LtrA